MQGKHAETLSLAEDRQTRDSAHRDSGREEGEAAGVKPLSRAALARDRDLAREQTRGIERGREEAGASGRAERPSGYREKRQRERERRGGETERK